MSGHTDRSPEEPDSPNIQDLELREEWQDDGFPRPLPEDCGSPEADSQSEAPPTTLTLSGMAVGGAKKRLVAPSLSLTLNRTNSQDPSADGFSAAALSATHDDNDTDLHSLDINLEALETPSGSETGTIPDNNDLEWDDDLPRVGRGGAVGVVRSPVEQPESFLGLDQVDSRGRRWRTFSVQGHEYSVDMSVLEPYLQVLSHGGYYGDGMNAIILFTSCYLPENTVDNYEYVMDNLFRYMVGTLDLMVSEDTYDLPRVGRGGAVGVVRSPVEQPESFLGLDQVDSRGRRWRTFSVQGHEYSVDMSVLEPYLQVLSHGGYYGDGMNAIILFTSCYLPENTVDNYEYVMDNLFRYMVGTLDLMVSEDYLLVYLCAMSPRNKLPSIKWLHQCYTSIDRRLKKDLKCLLVVHPAWFIKALITVVKPFISEKFSRKIRFVQNLQQLSTMIPTERLQIPESVLRFDEKLTR